MSDNRRIDTRPLSDLCDPARGITYGIVKVGEYTPGGVPVIRGGDIRDNQIVFNDEKRVSQEVSNSFSRTVLRGGEIVLNLIAEPGHSAIVPYAMKGFNVSRDVAVIPLAETVNHQFVNYYLKSPAAFAWLATRLQGSVTQKINLSTLRDLPVPLPTRRDQDAIADVLTAIDDKIECNDRIRRTSANLLGVTFERLTVPLAAFMTSGASPPLGWLVATLEHWLAAFETGRRPRGGVSEYRSGVPSIGAESVVELAAFDYSKTKFVPRDYFATMKRGVVHDRDVLLYKDGGRPGEFEPHVSMFGDGFPFPEFCINEHVYRMRAREPLTQEYLYCWLSSEPLREQMRRRGTGVAIPGLNSSAVRSLPIAVPPQDELREFSVVADPLVSQALVAAKEKEVLAKLRDTLLPPLLSGELRVRDAESPTGDSL
jgi:type I restriction enzyme S subunit